MYSNCKGHNKGKRSQWILRVGLLLSGPAALYGQDGGPGDWREDWAVPDGVAVEIDARGFDFPTAIAFVPNPGLASDAPLYYVTELRGTIKVVTNDRTVHTFASNFFNLTPEKELPAQKGETGLAGLCLDAANGYVFVTFTYQDQSGVLRNNVGRFETGRSTFALAPTSLITFEDIFAGDMSAVSHQIGPCQVEGDRLYVSVGDGEQPVKSQSRESLLGKIIRMTFDGDPVSSNPFYLASNPHTPADYVWATGLRNPFGLKIVDGRVFVADNGQAIDRFLEINAGQNYLWDGTDWSIGTNADVVFAPAVGLVQLDFYLPPSTVLPERYHHSFFVATSGIPDQPGPGVRGAKGIIVLGYDMTADRPATTPEPFLAYRGEGIQIVAGLAFGPDGLYFAPMFPVAGASAPIMKIVRDTGTPYPTRLADIQDADEFFHRKGCPTCHMRQGIGRVLGPDLDPGPLVARLRDRLNSSEYRRQVGELDSLEDQFAQEYRSWRQEVLSSEGNDRVRVWLRYRLMQPRFDNLNAQMPNLGLSEDEAEVLAEFLMVDTRVDVVTRMVMDIFPVLRYRHLVVMLGLGGILGSAVTATALYMTRRSATKSVA